MGACGARSGLEFPEVGAASRDGGGSAHAFPVGEYTDCAFGLYSTSGGLMGVDHRAVLSITSRGTALHARYIDQNGARSEVDFAPTTDTTATLVPDGATVSGAPHACVRGVGIVAREPTTLAAEEGALIAERNAVFLIAQGTATDVMAGPCGVQSDRQAVWIACMRRDRAAPSPAVGASAEAFPTGTFACQTQMATYVLAGSTNEYAADGAMGSLTVTQRGSTLSLSYTGDRSVSGTTDFALTSRLTARATTQSGLSAVCDVPISTPAATSMAPLDTAAGALALVGSTLFVTLAGTSRAPCAGAEKFVTLRCAVR